jgi:hypothetical protein
MRQLAGGILMTNLAVMRCSVVGFCFFTQAACAPGAPLVAHLERSARAIPPLEAVAIAEHFVLQNGYTSEPAEAEGMSPEALEIRDHLLWPTIRANSLQPTAYSYDVRRDGAGTVSGYTVYFCHVESTGDRPMVRRLHLGPNGEQPTMQHRDIFADAVDGERLEAPCSPR